MHKRWLVIPLLALAFFSALALRSPRVRAQIDPGERSYAIYQHDILVGEIYREDTDPGVYEEHWILSPRYVYVGERDPVTTVIVPSGLKYASTADFLARAAWSDGSRYVKTHCADGTTLPGRR